VLVVNTCAFIDRAKQESIDTILEMAELKKQAAGRKLVVTGCLAERYRDELKKEIPEIDAIYGTGEVEGLSSFMSGAASRKPGAAVPMTFHRKPVFGVDLPTYIYDADTPRKGAITSARSASFPRCAAITAAGRSSRSSRKSTSSPRKA
jgi:tRNA A37 methylthiotransferase MiaB